MEITTGSIEIAAGSMEMAIGSMEMAIGSIEIRTGSMEIAIGSMEIHFFFLGNAISREQLVKRNMEISFARMVLRLVGRG